jgi:hypothetical protein
MSAMACLVPTFNTNTDKHVTPTTNTTGDTLDTLSILDGLDSCTFGSAPEFFENLMDQFSGMPNPLLCHFLKMIRAQSELIFDFNKASILAHEDTGEDMHDWVNGSFIDIGDSTLFEPEKAMLCTFIKASLIKDTGEPLSINPFFGYAGRTYNDPVHTDEFIAAKTMYLAAGKRYDSERVQDMVDAALKHLRTYLRVDTYRNAVNIMLLNESRHAPVTKKTDATCPCDKHSKGIVRVSGCFKCCTNMPAKVSLCKCAKSGTPWEGMEDVDITCNHAGDFDPTLFAMTYFKYGICSICSKTLDGGDCQHFPFAQDAREVYKAKVSDPTSMEYVKQRIAAFDEAEDDFQYHNRDSSSDEDSSSEAGDVYDESDSEEKQRKRRRMD